MKFESRHPKARKVRQLATSIDFIAPLTRASTLSAHDMWVQYLSDPTCHLENGVGERGPGDTASETERSAEVEDYWSSELALSSSPSSPPRCGAQGLWAREERERGKGVEREK